MKRPRGRPLKPRSAEERVAFLDSLMGAGRARQEITLGWDKHFITIHAGAEGSLQQELGRGLDLGSAIDQAISMRYRRPK